MANSVMRKYEALFLVDSALATASWDDVITEIKRILETRANAEIESLEKWDERRLCFEIKKCSRGVYLLCYFKADSQVIARIERDVQISEMVLRVMILNAESIPEDVLSSLTPLKMAEKALEEQDAQGDNESSDVEEKKTEETAESNGTETQE